MVNTRHGKVSLASTRSILLPYPTWRWNNKSKEVFFWFYRRVIIENRKTEMKKAKKESDAVRIARNLKDT